MGIYIKGTEMPTCCDDCFALDDSGDYPYCLISHDQRGYTFRVDKRRMPSCPLIEVPTPHGDLIDKMALLNHMTNVHKEWQEHPDQHKSIITIVDDELMVCGFPAIIKEGGE